MSTVKTFIDQFVALVQGDDAKALAAKVKRKAIAGLKTQIAILEGETVSIEDRLDTAKSSLESARLNNGKMIDSPENYVRNLIDAQNAITEAEEALENHKTKVSYLQAQLAIVDRE